MIATMRRQTALLFASLLALAGLAVTPGAGAHADETRLQMVVSLTANAGPDALSGVNVVSSFPEFGSVVVNGTANAINSLRGRAGVRAVVPDYTLRPTTNDKNKPGKSVYASEGLGGRAGKPRAGRGVTVAVIDTGISDTPALNRASGRLHDGVDTSGEASFVDGYGHGTFMANIVAGGPTPGSRGNALGVAPGADVVNVKVADSTGETSLSEVLAGMSWVHFFADRIDVVEFAFSAPLVEGTPYGPDPLTDAVERLRAAGLAVVVSSGNETARLGDPGFDPYIITVGAADTRTHKVKVADFSGYGNVYGVTKPDVVASGVGVLSLMPANAIVAQENPQSLQPNGLYRGSGTSQASAVTAGVAALFLQEFPWATPSEVKTSLRAAATRVRGEGAGEGLVDVPHRLWKANGRGRNNPGTGEDDLDVEAWLANSWLQGGALEDEASAWGAVRWADEDWDASTFDALRWDAVRWEAVRWGAVRWGALRWEARAWSDTDTWTARAWSAAQWSKED